MTPQQRLTKAQELLAAAQTLHEANKHDNPIYFRQGLHGFAALHGRGQFMLLYPAAGDRQTICDLIYELLDLAKLINESI